MKGSDKLKSCEVRDGSTVEVTSRMRGGGRHKDNKSKVEKKQVTREEPLKRKIVDDMSGGSDIEVKRKMQHWETTLQTGAGSDEGQMKVGMWIQMEGRRQRRDEQQEQRRQAEQGQEQSKQGKQVRFGEEQQLGKTETENAGESQMVGRTTEVRTGRGRAGLVPGRRVARVNETSRKGKGKGNGGKGDWP